MSDRMAAIAEWYIVTLLVFGVTVHAVAAVIRLAGVI